jgi:Flp pilus assembly protein TadD
LYDSGDADGTLLYVMPVVQGQSLRQRLETQRQLPIADAVRIASEVAGALDHRTASAHRPPGHQAREPRPPPRSKRWSWLRRDAPCWQCVARVCSRHAPASNAPSNWTPQNADAFGVLGETLGSFVTYGLMPVADGRPLAKAALTRAPELAPENASVMGALGTVSLNLDHESDAAFVWWERALAMQPRLSQVRALYAMNGLILLRHDVDHGIRELARAVHDDPRGIFCACIYSIGLVAAGRVAEAIAEIERACDLNPSGFLPLYLRVFIRMWVGDADGALVAAKRAFAVVGRNPWTLAGVPGAYVQRGELALAEAVYVELQARAQTEEVSRFVLSFAAEALGRTDEAIAYAIESVERSDGTGPYWTRAPFFSDTLRAHPRHPELLGKLGLCRLTADPRRVSCFSGVPAAAARRACPSWSAPPPHSA